MNSAFALLAEPRADHCVSNQPARPCASASCLGSLDQTQLIASCGAKPGCAKRPRTKHRLLCRTGLVPHDQCTLRYCSDTVSHLGFCTHPPCQPLCQPPGLQPVSMRPVSFASKQCQVCGGGRHHQSRTRHRRQLSCELAKGKQGHLRRNYVELASPARPGRTMSTTRSFPVLRIIFKVGWPLAYIYRVQIETPILRLQARHTMLHVKFNGNR